MATAAKLCCPVPRAESPDDEPPRPIRHFRSLAHIASRISNNGKQTQSAETGLTDENHPLHPTDDLEFQRIFVAASLPEDHPDAIKMTGRKPEVDESIIRSPSFTKKLRRQLSRKSLATSNTGMKPVKKPMLKPIKNLHRQRESLSAVFSTGYDHDAQSLKLNDEHYASLRRNDSVVTFGKPQDGLEDVSGTLVDDVGLPCSELDEPRRSVSVPITFSPTSPPHQPRRSRSSTSLPETFRNMLVVDIPQSTFFDSDDMWPFPSSEPLMPPQSFDASPAKAPLIRPQTIDLTETLLRSPAKSILPLRLVRSESSKKKSQLLDSPKVMQKGSTNSLHLHNMQISQHLRTRSQTSYDSMPSNSDKPVSDRYTHASLNSVVLSSMGPKHHRNVSSSGFASSTVPSAWGKVIEDESSSIYSRRPSSTFEVQQSPSFEAQQDSVFDAPYEVLRETQGECHTRADSCSTTSRHKRDAAPIHAQQEAHSEEIAVILKAPPPGLHREVNSRRATAQQANKSDRSSEATSLPKSDSSGSLGKLSKFKEDLADSPAAKTSRKRRSVLRILFPRLARSRARSVSTPLLWEKTHDTVAMYDGPGDTSEMLSVQQKTPSKQSAGGRSVSFNTLVDVETSNGASGSTLAVPTASRSRRSMVEYERALSVVGDDRRRKSTFTGTAIPEIQTVDRSDSPKRSLHRASPLLIPGRIGTENTLMEKALQQHQLEKAALLRVNSKKSQAKVSPTHAPVFKSPFGGPSTYSSNGVPPAMDELDPLDPEDPSGMRKSQSMQELRASPSFPKKHSLLDKRRSTTWTASTVSAEEHKGKGRATISMVLWNQFPSHTRAKRCGSALRSDGVISRDFAYVVEPDEIHGVQSTDSEALSSSKRWSRLSNVKKRDWVVKSRSMTFGTVLRYYSELLTSSAARNRRSSTATGGRLEHPELEVLPPILPTSSHTDLPHHSHVRDQLGRLVDHIKDEGHHLKDEAHEIAVHHHRHRTPSPLQAKTSGNTPEAPVTPGKSMSEPADKVSHIDDDDDDEEIGPLDGTVEDKPADPPSARRLSRMYQACVRLPTSLNASRELDRMGSSEDSGLVENRSTSPAVLSKEEDTSKQGLLTVPSSKTRISSGPIVRRFPSATVVDDRKGHWRSISLISVDSGKSVRRSTRDLLEFFKTTENEEREKLMGATDEKSMEHVTST